MSKGIFKTSFMGGFKKSDVLSYLNEAERQTREREAAMQDELAQTKQQLEEAQSEAASTTPAGSVLSQSLDAFDQSLRELTAQKEEAEHALASANEELSLKSAELDRTVSECDELRLQLAQLTETGTQKDARIEELTQRLNGLSQTGVEPNGGDPALQSRIEGLTDELSQKDELVSQLTTQNAALEQRVYELSQTQAEFSQRESEFSLREAAFSQQEAELTKLRAEFMQLQAEFARREAELTRQKTEFEQRVAALKSQNDELTRAAYEAGRANDQIARVLLDARKSADGIIAEAKLEAQALLQQSRAKLQNLAGETSSFIKEVDDLRERVHCFYDLTDGMLERVSGASEQILHQYGSQEEPQEKPQTADTPSSVRPFGFDFSDSAEQPQNPQ